VTGSVLTEYQISTILKSEVDKIDFISFFANGSNSDTISVDDLKKVIDYELHQHTHAAGAFYAIDLGSVNTYFVDFLLQNYQDKDALFKYTLAIS
jgi:hypothetical protein